MGTIDFSGLRAHWVDLAMLLWLVASMLIGLARGLVFETLSLIGWGVAYFAATWAVPMLAPWLAVGEPGSTLNHGAALLCAFIIVLLGWALLTRLLRLLVHVTPLNLPDRVLGAGFGAVRGLAVLLAVATVVGLTPMAVSPAWQRSQGAAWLNVALHGIKPLLPNEISQHLPA
jgi:membrane protein required for colicin V production